MSDTDSKHSSSATVASRLALKGALVTTVVAAVILLVTEVVLPLSLAAGLVTSTLLIGISAFIAIRRIVGPGLERTEGALSRIEEMVGEEEARGPAGGSARNGQLAGEFEIVDRIERSVDQVETRISQLRRIENYRQEFLGDVSHELQTPIFAVQGFAETLLDGALDDPEVNRAFVEKILRHSQRLSTLVSDLSHIAQIETGSLKMNVEPFDAGQLVSDALEALELTAQSSEIELFQFVDPNIRPALGDRMRIGQVLENLITNGIKYNERGGRVEATVRQTEDNRVLFAVTDDGIGLSPEHFERVTERFYRVDRSRSRERGGTGLGLAIVKHILEAHGSQLRINSAPGRGSTFAFALDSADESLD